MDYEEEELGDCQYCGAPNERWRSGKVGCSAKCWLKNQPQQPNKQFVNRAGKLQVKKEPDWEGIRAEKAAGFAKGAAFNKAVDIVIALYAKGDITPEMIIPKVAEIHEKLKQINDAG